MPADSKAKTFGKPYGPVQDNVVFQPGLVFYSHTSNSTLLQRMQFFTGTLAGRW